jgi:hypothetical protein
LTERPRTLPSESLGKTMDRTRRRMLYVGCAYTGALALLCAMMAVWASKEGCGSTDGTFALDSRLARPSSFCRDTHFPGFPDTLGSALLLAAIYLTPVVAMAIGTLAGVVTGKRRAFNASLWIAGLLTLGTALLTSQASVGYAGGG